MILTISNVKGGVAKTTTAATLAAGLHKRGKSVLMVDADPQTNLSMCFLDEQDDGTPSLYHVFKREQPLEAARFTIKPGLDLILGDFSLCSADMEFLGKVGSLNLLKRSLETLSENYDYIIIDTPPNLGFLSLNAFMCSDYVITPMATDSFSLKAIRLLKQTLKDVSAETGRTLPVAGILLTRYTDRTNVAKILEESIQAAADLLDTTVFTSRIRQAIVVQESQLVKMDLFEYAPKAPVTREYDDFINELLRRIE